MSETTPGTWPENYHDLTGHIPDNINLSERVVEPLLRIRRAEDGYEAVLCGARNLRGEEIIAEAQSLSHNWVLDGTVIRPLPRDNRGSLNETFGSFELRSLSFADVLAVARMDQDLIRIELAEDVLVPARDSAASISEASAVPGLKAGLYPYQAGGVAWMHQTLRHTGGLILADEMGLGKTIQIISLLLLTPPTNDAPALVICPTSLISNWKREIYRFAPDLSVMVHRGVHRAGIFRDLQVAQVVITTYDTAVNDISIISAFEWGWVICDEAQAIKNPGSARRQALATIPRVRTIPMTGTPVENTLLDLWSLADFAIPGLLGTQDQFEAEYPDGAEAARELNAVTGPIVLRRRIKDVAGDLPDRIDVDLPIGLGDDLATEYERIREETLQKYPVAGALVATGQLQMFCAHPWLQAHKPGDEFWEDEVTVARRAHSSLITPKIERTIALIREAFANGRKVLVFSIFNRCGDLIREAMGDEGDVLWGAINGSTPQEDRQALVDGFSEHDGKACLILNPRAAGAGLNITAATVVIHFTQVWNPALEAQASARAHRLGQTEPVTIYRLYYEDTVEDVMIDRSQWKRDLGNEAVPISTPDLKRALQISPIKKND